MVFPAVVKILYWFLISRTANNIFNTFGDRVLLLPVHDSETTYNRNNSKWQLQTSVFVVY